MKTCKFEWNVIKLDIVIHVWSIKANNDARVKRRTFETIGTLMCADCFKRPSTLTWDERRRSFMNVLLKQPRFAAVSLSTNCISSLHQSLHLSIPPSVLPYTPLTHSFLLPSVTPSHIYLYIDLIFEVWSV